jgi:hypothetical protein
VIRQYPGLDLSWADKSDQDILEYVSQAVDDRLQRFAEAGDHKGLVSLYGGLVYGKADDSRADQIQRGITYYQTLREHQQQVIAAIEELRKAQR